MQANLELEKLTSTYLTDKSTGTQPTFVQRVAEPCCCYRLSLSFEDDSPRFWQNTEVRRSFAKCHGKVVSYTPGPLDGPDQRELLEERGDETLSVV